MSSNPSKYQELLLRQGEIRERLEEIAVPPVKVSPTRKKKGAKLVSLQGDEVPIREKTDTHWDYLMKEMQW